MITTLCPICGAPLCMERMAWHCPAGHSFDVARQGYVNLLTVGQKHSLHPGDTREMVAARRAFLNAGFYAPVAEAVCDAIGRHCGEPDSVLDVGCGEGYYLKNTGVRFPAAELWGVDISKEAVRFAAAENKCAQFLTGTAAHLPFADGTFSCLLSMFALTEPAEFSRVLRPNGIFIQVLAGEKHLLSLRRIIYPEILHREKCVHPLLPGFLTRESREVSFEFKLQTAQMVQNLLEMTPHVWRISREGAQALEQTQQLTDTAEIIVNVYQKQG